MACCVEGKGGVEVVCLRRWTESAAAEAKARQVACGLEFALALPEVGFDHDQDGHATWRVVFLLGVGGVCEFDGGVVLKSFVLAARPKTLPAAVVPVWAGCVLAYQLTGAWDVGLAVWTLLGAVFIQIGTNFFNDAIDARKGADTEARIGPKRVTASGMMSVKSVYGSALVSLLLASVCGWFLIEARGWPIGVIGVVSLYFSYGYTGGPLPLAYKGLGELFVILFFGLVAVTGTVFVQTGGWRWDALVLGLAVGCLSAVLISVNNLRDMDEDRSNNKRTLAVRWGRNAGVLLVRVMTIVAYACGIVLLDAGLGFLFLVVPFLLGVTIIHGLCKNAPGPVYNRFLAMAALQLVLFALGFHLAVVL